MKIQNIDEVQQYLQIATCILRRILSTDKRFEKRIKNLAKKMTYTLVEGDRKVNSVLVSFYGAYGGCGVVLLIDRDGQPALGVSIYPRRSSLEPSLWRREKRLPTEFVKILLTLRTQKRVREIFKGL